MISSAAGTAARAAALPWISPVPSLLSDIASPQLLFPLHTWPSAGQPSCVRDALFKRRPGLRALAICKLAPKPPTSCNLELNRRAMWIGCGRRAPLPKQAPGLACWFQSCEHSLELRKLLLSLPLPFALP